MYCALCVIRGNEPRRAITVLHGNAMCDLHVRETGKAIAKAWRRNEGAAEAVDGTIRGMVAHAASVGDV